MDPFSGSLALIPPRGGSKGLPGKYLQTVGGVPLIGRTVAAAKASTRVGRVVVSTDDDAIAAAAEGEGAARQPEEPSLFHETKKDIREPPAGILGTRLLALRERAFSLLFEPFESCHPEGVFWNFYDRLTAGIIDAFQAVEMINFPEENR